MLLNAIVDYCDKSYKKKCKRACFPCNHPTQCPQNCEICLEQVHYRSKYPYGRKDYNCSKIVDFYTCKYLYKYASEIEYALQQASCLDEFNEIHMLSIGCGPSPDLMAVQHYLTEYDLNIPIKYFGFDHNELWEPVQDEIYDIASEYEIDKVKFFKEDVIDYFSENSIGKANVLTLQYIISHMNINGRRSEITSFFDDLVLNVILKMESKSIIILNDINHYSARDRFIDLYNKIESRGRRVRMNNYYFEHNIVHDSQRFGTRHKRKSAIYDVPEEILNKYNPWMYCTSAQSIIELG